MQITIKSGMGISLNADATRSLRRTVQKQLARFGPAVTATDVIVELVGTGGQTRVRSTVSLHGPRYGVNVAAAEGDDVTSALESALRSAGRAVGHSVSELRTGTRTSRPAPRP